MRIYKFLAMSMAAFALASCGNDGLDGNGGKDTDPVSGQKTWTVFNFDIKEAVSKAVGENGTVPGTGKENAVSTIDLYIFGADNRLELATKVDKADGTTDAGMDGHFLAPAQPLEVTSGAKTFCVILNKCGTVTSEVGTSLDEFLNQVQTVSDYATLISGGLMGEGQTNLMMTGKTGEITLHPGITKEKVIAAAASTSADDDAANNVVTMYVNRNAAKLTLALKDGVESLDVKNKETKLASLSSVNFKVGNLGDKTYYFLQDEVSTVFPTPYYDQTSWTDAWKNQWYEQTDDQFSALKSAIYMTPNTHVQNGAKMGNTTYALVKGVYAPADGYVEGSFTNGQKSIFSYEYNKSYGSINITSDKLEDNIDAAKANIQSLVATRVAERYPALADIKADDVIVHKDKADYDKATKAAKVYAYLVPVQSGTATKSGHYNVVMKRWTQKSGAPVTEDANFKLTPLTIGVYDTTGEGLVCYYRVNVFTSSYAEGHAMYYSVVRNHVYDVTVNSVAKIGENNGANVDLPDEGNQNLPIVEETGYMQCSILIYKWVASNMNVDLGK